MMLEELKSQYLIEVQEDCVGLWRFIASIRERYGVSDPKEIRRLTLELVRRLLSLGLKAGDPPYSAEGYRPWPDQDPEFVIERIKGEWDALGREPNIGDIVWFGLPEKT